MAALPVASAFHAYPAERSTIEFVLCRLAWLIGVGRPAVIAAARRTTVDAELGFKQVFIHSSGGGHPILLDICIMFCERGIPRSFSGISKVRESCGGALIRPGGYANEVRARPAHGPRPESGFVLTPHLWGRQHAAQGVRYATTDSRATAAWDYQKVSER